MDAVRKSHGVFERTLQILLNPRSRELQLGEGSYIDGSPAQPKPTQAASAADAARASAPVLIAAQKEKWTEPELEKLREVIEDISSGSNDGNDHDSGVSLPWDEIARKVGTGRGVEAYRMRWYRLSKQARQPAASSPSPAKAAMKTIKPGAAASSGAGAVDAARAPAPAVPAQKEKWTEPELEKLREVIEDISSGSNDGNDHDSGVSLPWDEIARKVGTGRGVEAYRMRWYRLSKQARQPAASSPSPAKAAMKTIKPGAAASSGAGAVANGAAAGPRKLRRGSTTDHPNQIKIESNNLASAVPRPPDELEAAPAQRKGWERREQVTLLRLVQQLGVTLASDSAEWQALADRLGTERTGTAVAHR